MRRPATGRQRPYPSASKSSEQNRRLKTGTAHGTSTNGRRGGCTCSFWTFIGVDRFPHLRSFTTYCVRLELRSLHRHYPASAVLRTSPPPRASGLSLTGFRFRLLTTFWGFPCFVHFPCVHGAASTPAQPCHTRRPQSINNVVDYPWL
jgi:hypothetical protein